MDNPKVSIIVPIYRVEEYIERCAESLFAQTFDDIEYIFVDDCSPDKSVEILQRTLEKYPHRKRLTRIERLSWGGRAGGGGAAGVSVHGTRPGGAGRPAHLRTGHGAPAGHRVAGRRGDAADPGPAAAGIGQNATQNDRKRHTEGCVSFAAQYQVMPSRSCICTRRSSSSVSAAAERARPLGVTR